MEISRTSRSLTKSFGGKLCISLLSGLALILVPSSIQAQAPRDRLEQLNTEAQAALGRNDFLAAEKAFREIAKLEPGLAEVHSNLGFTLYMQNRPREAVPSLLKALELKPSLDSAKGLLGLCHFRLHQFQKCLDILQSLPSETSNQPIFIQHMAIALIQLKEYEKAIPVLDRWLEQEPRNSDAHYYKGQAALMLSVQTFNDLKRVDPDSYRLRQLQAELLAEQGHLEPAIGEYQKVIGSHPDVVGLHFALGKLYWANMRLDEALAEFEAEVKLSPDDPDTNYFLGNIYLNKNDLPSAEARLRKAIEVNPGLVDAHFDLAIVLRQKGDVPQAIRKLLEVAAMSPDHEAAHYNLFELYRKAGDMQKAQQEFRLFQDLKAKKANTEPKK